MKHAPMLDIARQLPARCEALRNHAAELAGRGFPSAAQAMVDAAGDLEGIYATHRALAEREERLTARLVELER